MANTLASEQKWANNNTEFPIGNIDTTNLDAVNGTITNLNSTVAQITNARVALLELTSASNQLVFDFGSSITTTISCDPPAAARAYEIVDINKPGFLMVAGEPGANQHVTQLTSLSTAVTTTATCGTVTLFSQLGVSGVAIFSMNNLNIKPNSCVIAWTNMLSGTDFLPHRVQATTVLNGTCTIQVENVSALATSISAPIVYYLIL